MAAGLQLTFVVKGEYSIKLNEKNEIKIQKTYFVKNVTGCPLKSCKEFILEKGHWRVFWKFHHL